MKAITRHHLENISSKNTNQRRVNAGTEILNLRMILNRNVRRLRLSECTNRD